MQNDFSAIPQTLNSNADNSWTVDASTVGQSDQTSVKSYPATQVTYTLANGNPEPSADFGSTLTSNFTNVVPSGSGQDYEYAADDWLADPTKPSWTNDLEIMIWTHVNGQVPAGSDTGQVYTDASGTQWEVWVAGGATTVSPDSTVSFVRKVNTDSGSFERIGFYKYLQQNGMLAATYGIDQLNYGLEICSTGGATRTYGISAYTTVVNGTTQQAPAVTTNAATGVTSSGATLNGSVNPQGAATSYQFDYGPTASYGSVTPAGGASAGSGTTAVNESAALSGLAPGTTEHYRIEATNSAGTTLGADQQFTTSAAPVAPVVTTTAATGVTSSGATLNGTVNPEGQATTYQFEYGPTTAYGSTSPATPGSAGSGTTAVNESSAVTGLAASATYHYRLNATNATGTTHGSDGTFTTSAAGGGSTVAFDAAAGAKVANASSLSWTQVVGSGANRALLVDFTVGTSNDAGCAPTVTDNGVAMSEITAVHDNSQHAGALTVWGLVNPPSGTNTVATSVRSCSGGTPLELTGGSESFTGVSQATPINWAHAIAAGSSGQSSVGVTSASTSDLVGEFVANGSSVTGPVSPVVQKFLENQDNNSGAGNTAGGYAPGAAGTVTGKFNLAVDWWGAAAVDIPRA